MAFVPKVHNREAPSANRHLDGRWQRDKHARHLQNIGRVKARIDNKWGQTYNGVTETKRATYPHVIANLKKAQMQDERFAEIEQENYALLKKLSTILERSHNPTRGTREWGGGVRLTSNQTPVIDHCIAAKTDMFGAAVESTSLNLRHRQEERERIADLTTREQFRSDEEEHRVGQWRPMVSLPNSVPILQESSRVDKFREEARASVARIEALPKEARRKALSDSGYLVPHWPKPWDRDAGPLEQLVIEEEFKGVRRPDLSISGDAELIQALYHFASDLDLKWEDYLAPFLGDLLTREATRASDAARQWGSDAAASLTETLDEYLAEEARILPSAGEIDYFNDSVAALRLRLDRLEARLQLLENADA